MVAGKRCGTPQARASMLASGGQPTEVFHSLSGRHTTGIPQGRPCRSGGGAQNRAFVLAHLLPPVMNKFPLPARVAADSVSAGSGSRDPANSGRPPAEYR